MQSDNSCVKRFESKNRFEVLISNPEEDVPKIVKRLILSNTSKRSLKKCKKCNFKRRDCLVDSAKCKASQRWCSKCKKHGHYPQSLYCKARKKIQSMIKIKVPAAKPFAFNADMLFLLNKRIDIIECNKVINKVLRKGTIPNDEDLAASKQTLDLYE